MCLECCEGRTRSRGQTAQQLIPKDKLMTRFQLGTSSSPEHHQRLKSTREETGEVAGVGDFS